MISQERVQELLKVHKRWNEKDFNEFKTYKKLYDPKKQYKMNLSKEFTGYGVYESNSKSFYEGLFLNGKSHGLGIKIWSDGSIYLGNTKQNKKHGKGTLIFKNGDKYQGTFEEDKYHGNGIWYWYFNKSKYVG